MCSRAKLLVSFICNKYNWKTSWDGSPLSLVAAPIKKIKTPKWKRFNGAVNIKSWSSISWKLDSWRAANRKQRTLVMGVTAVKTWWAFRARVFQWTRNQLKILMEFFHAAVHVVDRSALGYEIVRFNASSWHIEVVTQSAASNSLPTVTCCRRLWRTLTSPQVFASRAVQPPPDPISATRHQKLKLLRLRGGCQTARSVNWRFPHVRRSASRSWWHRGNIFADRRRRGIRRPVQRMPASVR